MPSIYNMPFLSESVKYFDVIDEAKLSKQIEDFILANKLPPLVAYFIAGQDAVLEKEFVLGSVEAINQFLEMIPYELVYSKKITKQKSVNVVALNGDFYRIVNNVLEKYKGHVISLLSYSLVSQNSLIPQTASLILKKADSLKNESLVNSNDEISTDESAFASLGQISSDKEEKSTLPILIPIFAILVIVLIIVIYFSSQSQRNTQINLTPTATPFIVPSPTNFILDSSSEATSSPTKIATNSAL